MSATFSPFPPQDGSAQSLTFTPQQAALDRINALLVKSTELLALADRNLELALIGASTVQAVVTPEILEQQSLVDLALVRNGLRELVEYHKAQHAAMSAVVATTAAAAAAPAPAAEETLPAATAEAAAPVPEKKATLEELRQCVERTASQVRRGAGEQEQQDQPARYQPVGPSRDAAPELARRRELSLAEGAAATATTADGLPEVTIQPESPQQRKLPEPAPIENSLTRLLGATSPLLDIFAPSPWIPAGKGKITVSSKGFQWYKGSNPLTRTDADRARLPSGFYAGEDMPEFVVLRLKTVILVWKLNMLTSDNITVYLVGVSDQDPANPRWFNPQSLSASYTRRVVQELIAFRDAPPVAA